MRKGAQYTLDDYIITKEGKVFNKHNNHESKLLKNGKGYYRVNIGHTLYFVHRLVAKLYVPNPENKLQVNHIDGNKENNNYKNLEWVTNQENRNHAVENDLHISGTKCSYSKLNELDVIYILKHKEIPSYKLAEKYNVSQSTICDIRHGRTWKQLKRYAEL